MKLKDVLFFSISVGRLNGNRMNFFHIIFSVMAFGGSVDMFAYVLMVKVGLENKCLVNKKSMSCMLKKDIYIK